MNEKERYNRVNLEHHLRDDVVVLLPHVAYRNGTIGFGDGCILPRHESDKIGDAILRMLDHCATADTRPLEERRDAAMDRLRKGFELTFDEHFPSFGIPDNWGRIYEQYPEILLGPLRSAHYFSSCSISDRDGPELLILEHLVAKRRDRGIYHCDRQVSLDRGIGSAAIGEEIARHLESWRPNPGLLTRLFA